MTISKNFERFLNFILLYEFSEKLFQKKTNKREYRPLVESAKIENARFPCKTALSEANAKANKMGSTIPLTTKFFSKFCFSLRTSYKELI